MTKESAALKVAIAAILCEAKDMGINIDELCEAAKAGVFDGGKRYRGGSADVVVFATAAIDTALDIAKHQP